MCNLKVFSWCQPMQFRDAVCFSSSSSCKCSQQTASCGTWSFRRTLPTNIVASICQHQSSSTDRATPVFTWVHNVASLKSPLLSTDQLLWRHTVLQVEDFISISFSRVANTHTLDVDQFNEYMILVYNEETNTSQAGSVSFGFDYTCSNASWYRRVCVITVSEWRHVQPPSKRLHVWLRWRLRGNTLPKW